ncbi:MAG: ribonuclease P protein component [Hydrogenophaga sp.]|nr:ribonuclease P protein component [Hydrogenophaga sp.]
MQRIRTRPQFQAAMAGAIVAKTPHFALHRLALPDPEHGRLLFPVQDTWIGVVLPKRWAKRAVTRNSLRRQVYEVSRAVATQLPQAALVVRLRSGFDRQQFVSATSDALKRAAREELQQLLARVSRPAVGPAC